MVSWIVCENVRLGQNFREFELHYQQQPGQLRCPKRVVRLWEDGGLEIGSKNSPFMTEYSIDLSRRTGDDSGKPSEYINLVLGSQQKLVFDNQEVIETNST
jgi:hypothetical protein